MTRLSKREAIDLMNSDMKLWERASSEDLGGGKVVKTLDLPFGIGQTDVTIEGLTDAGKKRSAVAGFGEYIRGLIKERIDDEAVVSRAKAAAARVEQDGGERVVRDSAQGVSDQSPQASANESTEQAYEEPVEVNVSFGETLTARRSALKDRIERVESDLARWRKELKGIDAALEAMED